MFGADRSDPAVGALLLAGPRRYWTVMPSRGTRQPPISDCEAPSKFVFGFSKLEVMLGRQSVDD
jgi:hypothetical protein